MLVQRNNDDTRVLAVGRPEDVDRHPANAAARRIPTGDSVLIPALVNAHAHLDLTGVGPQPPDPEAGFAAFIDLVRARRPRTTEAIDAAVRRGAEMAMAGGTAAIGDIAGAVDGRPRLDACRALARTPLRGVSYLEFFAIGRSEERGLAAVQAEIDTPSGSGSARIRVGLQPHAPYSVSPRAYRWAFNHGARRAMPVCTHLAESSEERAFVGEASGPIREFLERIGIWEDGLLTDFGLGRSPVAHLVPLLTEAGGADGLLAVHVNDASDADIDLLARSGASVAYCPRASAYFRAEQHFGPHRYRDMLAAGINLALGTDSVINLWEGVGGVEAGKGGEGRPQDSLSILDEIRLLFRRDRVAPGTLLAMGTVNGARALGLDPAQFRFAPDAAAAGVLAISVQGTPTDRPPLERALLSTAPPTWLAGPGAATH